jgi:hypothetical protein
LKQADPRALDSRFTIGRVLALTARSWLGCRWPIALIVVPTAIADVSLRWLVDDHLGGISGGWRDMILMWLDVPVECVAFVSIIVAALLYARGQRTGVRNMLSIPWRRTPVVAVAGLILQTITYWPIPLLPWPEDSEFRLLVDYLVLTINVLAFDVLAFVLTPALLVENRSLIDTFRRSVQFALRHPWRLLAIDIGVWVTYLMFSSAVTYLYYQTGEWWTNLAWVMWVAIMLPFTCCLGAAAYHLIRQEQEGPAPEALARVFD